MGARGFQAVKPKMIRIEFFGILHLPVYAFLSFRAKREIHVSLLEMTVKSVNYFLSVMKDVNFSKSVAISRRENRIGVRI